MQSGTARNVIAESAHFSGTVRTLDNSVRTSVRCRIHETILGCASACGVEASVDYREELPVLVNSHEMCDIAARAVRGTLRDHYVREIKPSMAGDDFALYGERIPGCYIFMGATPNGQEVTPLHSPESNPDERVIPMAAPLWAHTCWEMVK